jgi:putative solute:sodium symporter small subunit
MDFKPSSGQSPQRIGIPPRQRARDSRPGRTGEERLMQQDTNTYWSRTTSLMLVMMGLWLFFSFIIHMFVIPLNGIKIAGFPFGFYMASQGSLIAFVAMLFWFARAQDKIDRDCGVAEDE